MNRSVRRAVVERSAGLCECCGRWVGEDGTLDHAFGRKNAPESVETCWFLCWEPCHAAKTRNDPDAKTWVGRYLAFCFLHGYAESMKRCQMRLEWIAARNQGTS